MELAARIVTMARRGAPLPYLRRVAYLESVGAQWIDSLIVPTIDDVIKCKFNMFTGDFRTSPFGCYTSVVYDGIFIRAFSPRSYVELAFLTRGAGYGTIVYNNSYGDSTCELSYDRLSYNGETTKNSKLTGITPSVPLFLFTMNNNGSPQRLDRVRIYSFTIEREGVVIVDMIPVLDLSGRPAMYDEVSGQFFYNQGTGEFTWGELDAASGAFSTEGGGY